MAKERLEMPKLVSYRWKNEEGWYVDWGESCIFLHYEIDEKRHRSTKKWHADRSGIRVTSWRKGGVLIRRKPAKTPGPDYESRKITEEMEKVFKEVNG
jgi:hypothetical protein